MRHVRQLLAPQGLLVLVEGTGPQQWLDLIFGMIEGWWKFTDHDLRPAHALISQSEWLRLLKREGFELPAAFPDENEESLIKQSVILARAPRAEPAPRAPSEWLIFGDKGGLADRLIRRLAARGERCILVSSGADFRGTGAEQFEINPANPGDFERLLMETHAVRSNAVLGVLHLWSLDNAPLEKTTAEQLEADQVSMCGSVVHLVQALAKQSFPVRLWLVSRGAQAVTPSEAAAATQAPIWGLGRVIALERPEIWGGVIDLGKGADEDTQVSQLLSEAGRDDSDGEDQIAFRNNLRHVARLVPYKSEDGISGRYFREALFASNGTYLITGGLGRVPLMMAQWMAQRGARHLLLLSRRRLPERRVRTDVAVEPDTHEAVRTIRAIEDMGAEVKVVCGDVSDVAAMSELFKIFGSSMPSLRGLIHAAGVFSFQSLKEMNIDLLKACLRPKVTGAWVLHHLTKNMPLDFFVTFSSGASVWSAKGLAHYAAANQFLDAVAHYRHALGLPALTVNWGWWAGGNTSAAVEESFAQFGLKQMSAADAFEIFGRLLQMNAAQITVAACDWGRSEGPL